LWYERSLCSGESRERTGYFRISDLNSVTFNLLVCAIESNFGNVNVTYHSSITHLYIRLVETSTRDFCVCVLDWCSLCIVFHSYYMISGCNKQLTLVQVDLVQC
jgi:hypothetical protein